MSHTAAPVSGQDSEHKRQIDAHNRGPSETTLPELNGGNNAQ